MLKHKGHLVLKLLHQVHLAGLRIGFIEPHLIEVSVVLRLHHHHIFDLIQYVLIRRYMLHLRNGSHQVHINPGRLRLYLLALVGPELLDMPLTAWYANAEPRDGSRHAHRVESTLTHMVHWLLLSLDRLDNGRLGVYDFLDLALVLPDYGTELSDGLPGGRLKLLEHGLVAQVRLLQLLVYLELQLTHDASRLHLDLSHLLADDPLHDLQGAHQCFGAPHQSSGHGHHVLRRVGLIHKPHAPVVLSHKLDVIAAVSHHLNGRCAYHIAFILHG